MFKISLLAAGALALSCGTAAHAAGKDIDGYRPERAALASQLPVYLIVLNDRVRPQMDFARRGNSVAASVRTHVPGTPYSDATEGNPFAGPLVAALVNQSAYEQSAQRAEEAHAGLVRNRCDLPVAATLQAAVRDAVARAPWGAEAAPIVLRADEKAWEEKLPKDQPRHVFAVTSSLSPNLGTLVTTLDIAAYATDGAQGPAWRKRPLWQDQLIVVSDWLEVDVKTEADVERMVAAERRRFVESGDQARIAKANGGSVDADQRAAAKLADQRHKRNLMLAREDGWSVDGERMRRAELWSQDDCAPLRAALAQGAAELGRMIDAVYAQALPPRMPLTSRDTGLERPGDRQVRALPGGVFVSRNEGGSTPLEFRFSLLPLKK